MSDFHRFCLRRKRFWNSAEQGLFVWSMKWIRDIDVWMCGKHLYIGRGYDRSRWLIQVGGGVSVLSPHSHTNPAALRPVVWVITDPNSHGISGVVNLDGRWLEGIKRKCRHIVIDDMNEVCRRLAPTWPKGWYRLGTANCAYGVRPLWSCGSGCLWGNQAGQQ